MSDEKYDLFISHNSLDKSLIDRIAQRLYSGYDIRSWLDKWDLAAAADWAPAIERALRSSNSCAVVLGANGWGQYHSKEAVAALERREKNPEFRVIPVLLPGANAKDMVVLGDFFTRTHRVDFSNGVDDEEAFQRLLSAIRGEAPGPPPMTVFSIRRDAERWKLAPHEDKKSVLYSGGELRVAQEIANQYAGQLTDLAVKFLAVSATEEQQRIKAEQRRTQKIITGLVIGLIILVALTGVAFAQRQKAKRQEQIAETRREEAELQTQIAEENTKIAQSQQNIAEIQKSIAEQESIISEAQKQISEIRSKITNEEAKISAARGRIAELQRKKAEREERRANLQRDIAEERREVALSRQLSAQSEFTRAAGADFLPLSLLLGIEGLKSYPTWEADWAIRNNLALLPRVTAILPHGERVASVAVSESGEFVATTSGEGSTGGGAVRVWRARDGREVEDLSAAGPGPVIFSPKGDSLAYGSRNNDVTIREVPSGRVLARLPHDVNMVTPAAFSPDGKYLATIAYNLSPEAQLSDGTIRVWSLTSNRQVTKIEPSDSPGLAKLAFLDNERLATTENTIQIWNAADGTEVGHFDMEESRQILSPNGKYLARVKGRDGGAEVIATATGQTILEIKKEFLERAFFSPDGKYIAISDTKSDVQIWALNVPPETPAAVKIGKFDRAADTGSRGVIFSSDSKYFTANTGGRISIWELPGGRLAAKFVSEGAVDALEFSPDEKYVVTAGNGGVTRLWEVTARPDIASYPAPNVYDFSISGDGQYLAAATRREVRIWDIVGQRQLPPLTHGRGLLSVAFDPKDSTTLVTGTNADEIAAEPTAIWRWTSNDRKLFKQMDGHVQTLQYSPRGRYLAAGISAPQFTDSNDFGLWVWDAASGKVVLHNKGELFTRVIAFSPDEKFVAISGSFSTVIYEVESGKEVFKSSFSRSVAYSRDGKYFALARDKVVIVHRLDRAGRPDAEVAKLTQEGDILSLDFGPQSTYLATGGADNTVRVWYLASSKAVPGPREVVRIPHEGTPTKVFFHSDSRHLITGANQSVRAWLWKPNDLLAYARHRMIRPLTVEERRQYIGYVSPVTEPSSGQDKHLIP